MAKDRSAKLLEREKDQLTELIKELKRDISSKDKANGQLETDYQNLVEELDLEKEKLSIILNQKSLVID